MDKKKIEELQKEFEFRLELVTNSLIKEREILMKLQKNEQVIIGYLKKFN